MTDIASMLEGGDRRSIGRVDEVVTLVDRSPELLTALLAGLENLDEVVRMRCADAIEKISRQHAKWLDGHSAFLIGQADQQLQQEVRWHLAQIIPRLELTAAHRTRSIKIFKRYLADQSGIVRVSAMQALADLTGGDRRLRRGTIALIERMMKEGTPAVKARGRKLLATLRK